jgi:membrane-bound lytic murein transglycosylase D
LTNLKGFWKQNWMILTFCVLLIVAWMIVVVPRIQEHRLVLESALPISYSIVDTSNIRIKQWVHYFKHSARIDTLRRNFFYTQIFQMFKQEGFDDEHAKIYSEIPTIESGWKIISKSSSGAIGLWQILPSTGKQYGAKLEDLYDPVVSTKIAIAYIKDLERTFGGDIPKVLFSYYAGLGVVNTLLTENETTNVWLVPFDDQEAYNYAPKVLGAYLAMN